MTEPLFAPEQLPEIRHRIKPGEIWQVGVHRVGCLDALDPESYRRLMGDERAQVVDCDGPYGMNKDEWDRLNRADYRAFYVSLFGTIRPYLLDNASVYLWGNAPELWHLLERAEEIEDADGWSRVRGFSDLPFWGVPVELRNCIVWDKGSPSAVGGASPANNPVVRMYPPTTESCLFWMLGAPTMSTNADQYWEGWEPIRAYLNGEFKRAGLTTRGVGAAMDLHPRMVDHWISRSQWCFLLEHQYNRLRDLANGDAFCREYDAFCREYDDIRREYDDIRREWMSKRAPFDNTWDNMRDVWTEPRVIGADRWGHPTPKPVAFARRIAKTSARAGDICLVPFAGSSPWSEAAPMTGRILRTMDKEPRWANTAVTRLERWTGLEARRVDL